jgi:hypothetical protein
VRVRERGMIAKAVRGEGDETASRVRRCARRGTKAECGTERARGRGRSQGSESVGRREMEREAIQEKAVRGEGEETVDAMRWQEERQLLPLTGFT